MAKSTKDETRAKVRAISGVPADAPQRAVPDDPGASCRVSSDAEEPAAPPPGMGASITRCLHRIADSFGIRVSEKAMELGRSSQLHHYLQMQADNMGLSAAMAPLPERFTAAQLPALVQYADGSFAVVEKRHGRMVEIWNGASSAVRNDPSGLEPFGEWACSFASVFETDAVPFLSLTWFTGQVGRMWPIYSQVVLASVMIHCFTLVIPLLMGIFYDRILPNLAGNSLRVLATGAVIVLGFDYLLKNIRSILVEKAALQVEREAEPHLLREVFNVVHAALPASVGHLTHAVQEFSRIKTLFTSQLVLGAIDFFFLFFFLFVIFLNSGVLVMVPLVISLLVLVVSLAYGLFIDRTVSMQARLQSRRSSFLNEVFQGMESIKVTNASRAFVSRWAQEVEKSGEMGARYRLAQSRCSMTTSFLSQLNSVGLVVVAFALIGSGSMSSGGLLTTMVLSGRCVAVCASVANLVTSYLFARRSYKDLYAILQLEKESGEGGSLQIQNVRGDLAFDAVSFRYQPEAPYVLENISFSVRAGERVGVIGPMGSGKTTLLKLLAGLARPSEGVLLLDGHNMAHLNVEKVREKMGVVSQSPVLFHGTLEFNLLMGARNVSQDALEHALLISGIDTFVSRHPLGLKMPIAEGGRNLSRGQRQSVAIARALIGDPPILLLDEPTSSMDSTQEHIFVERMSREMEGKTMLIVTHRPNILRIVDRILVIDQGRLVADGPRDAILAKLGQAPAHREGRA
ncbi:ATP-binding cassette domain-containing protein [Pseudodesulfovibrio sp.]|uniref:ATP-binding cassette domain-containing protein n=1 Tax=Pseudodesulfovibrio sp. TaxID=2035812 RepID=UPI00262C410A|nr:ATP-binding cassette domain-containing protein [Pseudodesulfovibrio sp.]MDD3312459.1 ATP-binding cassette domain-containing protein [Pseudodesulfovibrio sp.]